MASQTYSSDILFLGDGAYILDAEICLSEDGRVLDFKPYEKKSSNHFSGALTPGFINCHCHLELSPLKCKVAEGGGLVQFITDLQASRKMPVKNQEQLIEAADQMMIENGIVAVGDISNGTDSLRTKKSSNINYHTFIELFGFDENSAEIIFEKGKLIKKQFQQEGLCATITPHSPYSVSEKLMNIILEKESELISIHHQETKSENELFQEKKGGLLRMMTDSGVNTQSFKAKHKNSANYLADYAYQGKMQMVHNTFSTQADIKIVEKYSAEVYWCFCPKANLYIENRLPNIPLFIELGVKCTLGTDSLASNSTLSILEEMKLIQKTFPEIKLHTMTAWACANGADFLAIEELGRIVKGKKPGLIHISSLNGELQLTPESKVSCLA